MLRSPLILGRLSSFHGRDAFLSREAELSACWNPTWVGESPSDSPGACHVPRGDWWLGNCCLFSGSSTGSEERFSAQRLCHVVRRPQRLFLLGQGSPSTLQVFLVLSREPGKLHIHRADLGESRRPRGLEELGLEPGSATC